MSKAKILVFSYLFIVFTLLPVNKAKAGPLFVNPPQTGSIEVTLHPGNTVNPGDTKRIVFGVPFPRKFINDLSLIRVTDETNHEIPAYVEETARWRSLSGDTSVDSLRAVRIFINNTFDSAGTKTILVHYGQVRTQNLASPGSVEDTWVAITLEQDPDEYPSSENITEPAVYATLPAEWLGQCLIRTRTLPLDASDSGWGWFDGAYPEFGKTAVNDVSEYVTTENRINYLTAYAPWLFDRAMTLHGLYVQTGDVKWLRHGHRATQFYKYYLSAAGFFDLKASNDLKYSYGQAMFADLMLLGDTTYLTSIENVAGAVASWNHTYTLSSNFWTERHQTYALLGSLSAWEATGKTEYANRVKEIVEASFHHALNPPDPGWNTDGCLLHTIAAHGDGNSGDPVCSPWMSALFADAMWRYYIHSEDEDALVFLGNLGDYVKDYGSYTQSTNSLAGKVFPWYLASSMYQDTDSGVWGDLEHTCDVSGVVMKAAWAKAKLGDDPVELVSFFNRMRESCEYDLDYWHRPDGDINYGKAVWRLSPPRKFNWWFGSNADMRWMEQSINEMQNPANKLKSPKSLRLVQ